MTLINITLSASSTLGSTSTVFLLLCPQGKVHATQFILYHIQDLKDSFSKA